METMAEVALYRPMGPILVRRDDRDAFTRIARRRFAAARDHHRGMGGAAYQGDAFRKLWGPIGFITAMGIGWVVCFNTQIGIVENYIRQYC